MFICEGPEPAWLQFEKQNRHFRHRGLTLLCCFLPCQKHLVGFGVLRNSASAVPVRGQGVLLPHDVQDAWETPCPLAKGALRCWDWGSSKPWAQVARDCAGHCWEVAVVVPPLCFEPVSCARKLRCWRVWGVENFHRHVPLYL